jgi:tRNA (guanine-N7-)-methyltransferase
LAPVDIRPHPYAWAPRLPEGEPVDPRTVVGRSLSRIELEIGPGRGGFLFERLATEPTVGMIGLEIRWKWAALVDERLKKLGLYPRGRVFAEDARRAVTRLQSASFDAVFVHFPDPWWKKRHTKRLVVTPLLVQEIARVLVPGGELFIQTDVADRAERYEEAVQSCGRMVPWQEGPQVADNPYRARSPREQRVEADGLPVVRLRYRRSVA